MEKAISESSFTVPEYPETDNRTPPHIDADSILNQHIAAHGDIRKIKGSKEKQHRTKRTQEVETEQTPQNNNDMASQINRASQDYTNFQTHITSRYPPTAQSQQMIALQQLNTLQKIGLATLTVGGFGLVFYWMLYCRSSSDKRQKVKVPKSKNPNVEIEVEEEEEEEAEEEDEENEQEEHGKRSEHKPKRSK